MFAGYVALPELLEPLACWRVLPNAGQPLPLLRPLFRADRTVAACCGQRQVDGGGRHIEELSLCCSGPGCNSVPLWPPVSSHLSVAFLIPAFLYGKCCGLVGTGEWKMMGETKSKGEGKNRFRRWGKWEDKRMGAKMFGV